MKTVDSAHRNSPKTLQAITAGSSQMPVATPIRKVRFSHRVRISSNTGTLKDVVQPDGYDALAFEDGSSRTRIWNEDMTPGTWKPKQKTSGTKTSTKIKAGDDTFLPHLNLGDIGLPTDMILGEPYPSDVESLQKHDFAFVRRSDNVSFTYAIIASKTKDVICFVVDDDAKTKILSRKHWSTHIRRTIADRSTWSPLSVPAFALASASDVKVLPPPPL